MASGLTGTHVAGETGEISDDNIRDNAILALQATVATLVANLGGVAGVQYIAAGATLPSGAAVNGNVYFQPVA
jgi:hypothetical protein